MWNQKLGGYPQRSLCIRCLLAAFGGVPRTGIASSSIMELLWALAGKNNDPSRGHWADAMCKLTQEVPDLRVRHAQTVPKNRNLVKF